MGGKDKELLPENPNLDLWIHLFSKAYFQYLKEADIGTAVDQNPDNAGQYYDVQQILFADGVFDLIFGRLIIRVYANNLDKKCTVVSPEEPEQGCAAALSLNKNGAITLFDDKQQEHHIDGRTAVVTLPATGHQRADLL